MSCTPSDVEAQLVLLRRKAALRVQVAQLGAWTKFGGARRRARAVSGVRSRVLAIYRPAIAALALETVSRVDGFGRERPAPAARPSARRQTSSTRPAGSRAHVDDNFKRAAGAAKRHHVGSAPLVGLSQPEHCRRRRHGDFRWRARSASRCRLWRCVLMLSVCGAGRQGGRRSGFHAISTLAPSTRARTRRH